MRRDLSLPPSRRVAGFTLIELMMVVAVIAILAAVALPAYGDYLRRGQLPEAFSHLADYQAKMEQYYQDNRNYGTAGTTCADAAGAGTWATFIPPGTNNFTYGCVTAASSQQYVITATGKSGTRVVGHAYTIDQNGVRSTTSFKGTSVSATCWLSKGTEC